MVFEELKIGDEFTVEGLSGSFIKVAEFNGYKHNAVSTFDEMDCFIFKQNQAVNKLPAEIEDCE